MPIKICSEAYFQAWCSLTSLKSETRDSQLKVPAGGLVLRIFTSWKNPTTSVVFELANLGSRGVDVTPRPPRPTFFHYIGIIVFLTLQKLHLYNKLLFFVHVAWCLWYCAYFDNTCLRMIFDILFYMIFHYILFFEPIAIFFIPRYLSMTFSSHHASFHSSIQHSLSILLFFSRHGTIL